MQRNSTGPDRPAHTPKRWRRWLLAGAAVLLTPLALHNAQRDSDVLRLPAGIDIAAASLSAHPLSLLGFIASAEPLPAPGPGPAAEPIAAAGVAAVSSGPIDMEICGSGMVKVLPDDTEQLKSMQPSERSAALDRVDALMLASPDERVRAAALLIGARSRGDQAHDWADRLARLAVGSQDPAVYAMAIEACQGLAANDAGACQLLSRAHWVRLDPDNIFPWLELAAEARDRFEPEAQADAMRHAALARRMDAYEGLLPDLVERALGSRAPPLQRTLALRASWNVQMAWVLSRSAGAHSYCVSDAVLDADDRRHNCEAIAQSLAPRSLRLADLGVGLAIDKGLGWSAERVQAMQRVNTAISAISGLPTIGLDLTCDGVARMQAWLRELDARGEMPAMRAVLAGAGRSAEAH